MVVFRDASFESVVGCPVPVGAPLRDALPWAPSTFERAETVWQGRSTLALRLTITPTAGATPGIAATVVGEPADQRHELVDALRISEQTLRSLIDACPVCVLTLDREMNVTLWNPAAEALFGWTAEEVVGMPYPLVPEGEWASFQRLFDRVLAGEGFTDVEGQRATKAGRPLDLRIHTAPLRTATGRVTGAMALLEDLTDHKRLEERVRNSHKMEAVGRLAGGVAHDFNNLLTVILGMSELLLLRRKDLDEEVKRALIEIKECGERARNLTAQLLAFSRRQVLRPVVADLNELVITTTKLLRRVIGVEVRVLVELHDEPILVRVDANQFDQMLVNLAVNARDAMPSGGMLSLRTRLLERERSEHMLQGRCAVLEVRDDGEGIDEAVLSHVFEPFFTTKAEGEGTGLGLSTVHGIAEQSGGTVEVESELGVGTVFRIFLPIAPVPYCSLLSDEVQVVGGSESVLLVEDDAGVRKVTELMLDALGYRVTCACDGREALERLGNDASVDLVLTDLSMPRMNGLALAEELARRHPELKVVLMSAHLDLPELRERVEAGELFFLQKPANRECLAQRLRDCLDGDARDVRIDP